METTKINNKYYQECDVIMLPSKEKSVEGTLVLFHNLYSNKEWYLDRVLSIEMQDYLKVWAHNGLLCEGEDADVKGEYQDIYILSNEEIKKGDYYELDGVIRQQPTDPVVPNIGELWGARKVIATTDKSLGKIIGDELVDEGTNTRKLIGEVLPQIPESFIEHYVSNHRKNNTITKVLVEVEKKIFSNAALGYNEYVELIQIHKIDNIYIPIKIEANIHQTTYQLGTPIEMDDYELDIETKIKLNQNNEINILTEIEGKKLLSNLQTELNKYINKKKNQDECSGFIDGFEKACELSERMYSEEEVLELLLKGRYTNYNSLPTEKWFEQFKKN
jgi:hypothetical protein